MNKIFIIALIFFTACKKETPANTTGFDTNGVTQIKGSSLGITGDTTDVATNATPGFVLMGGGADVSAAIKWMLQRSDHGDVVVIRSTGTDAYDKYMYNLYPVNSVETLLINSRHKANDPAVADKIKKAECLFIAGGDQWDYITYWKNTLVNDAINYLINMKEVPVGGTSAGCMVLGGFCFDAQYGTVTSHEMLNNPYNKYATITSHFINIPFLQNIIVDTHYNDPDREGRQTGFMARLFQDSAVTIKGIGLQEETAVAVDEAGNGKIYGSGKAFFLNAQIQLGRPEKCKQDSPLTWNKNAHAIKVYKIQGSKAGNGSVDIIHFNNFKGGSFEYFSAKKGDLIITGN